MNRYNKQKDNVNEAVCKYQKLQKINGVRI